MGKFKTVLELHMKNLSFRIDLRFAQCFNVKYCLVHYNYLATSTCESDGVIFKYVATLMCEADGYLIIFRCVRCPMSNPMGYWHRLYILSTRNVVSHFDMGRTRIG